jgi:hypothetical protein
MIQSCPPPAPSSVSTLSSAPVSITAFSVNSSLIKDGGD